MLKYDHCLDKKKNPNTELGRFDNISMVNNSYIFVRSLRIENVFLLSERTLL